MINGESGSDDITIVSPVFSHPLQCTMIDSGGFMNELSAILTFEMDFDGGPQRIAQWWRHNGQNDDENPSKRVKQSRRK